MAYGPCEALGHIMIVDWGKLCLAILVDGLLIATAWILLRR